MNLESVKKILLSKWWLFALFAIFLAAYCIRSAGIVEDRILSFDPVFQYRFTKYFADWGHFPVWDELSYYVGRADTPANSQLMWMITAGVYNFFKSSMSLFTVASYMGAIYGALIVVSAFLLGRELSNKYGGLLAAVLIGTAPQILVRTFGASYDTDQIALFFLLLTLYIGFRCLRKKTVESAATAILVYSAAMLSWGDSMFTFVILCGYTFVLLFAQWLLDKSVEKSSRFSSALKNFKWNAFLLVIILFGVQLVGIITKTYDALGSILSIASFAQKAEVWIVNISIAELQPFNVFSMDGWMQAMGRFQVGDGLIDGFIFLAFLSFMIFGLTYTYKKNINTATLMTAIFVIAFYVTTRGIRFTEFSSCLFLIIIAAGFGRLVEFLSNRGLLLKSSVFGIALLISFFAFSIGSQLGFGLGPDIDKDWDDAWGWIKNNTPEDAVIGTWWDPGHMIAGIAERRNFADGAHCPNACKYTINDRIVDLGKIMATTNESISLELIRKYQGTGSKVYWIASDDLIPKFQWPQFFGLGCGPQNYPDKCPSYVTIPLQGLGNSVEGNLVLRNYLIKDVRTQLSQDYQSIILFETNPRVAAYNVNGNIFLFNETIYQEGNQIMTLELNANLTNQTFRLLDPILKQMKMKPTNQTISTSVWLTKDFGAAVVIPPNLRQSVFTKMFMFEGNDLEHFKKVYGNNRVKIFEVVH